MNVALMTASTALPTPTTRLRVAIGMSAYAGRARSERTATRRETDGAIEPKAEKDALMRRLVLRRLFMTLVHHLQL